MLYNYQCYIERDEIVLKGDVKVHYSAEIEAARGGESNFDMGGNQVRV